MFCKKCGKELKDGQKFCVGCGTAIGNGERMAQVRQNPPVNHSVPANQYVQPGPAAPQRNSSQQSNNGIVIAIVAGVVVIIIAAVILAIVLFSKGGEDSDSSRSDMGWNDLSAGQGQNTDPTQNKETSEVTEDTTSNTAVAEDDEDEEDDDYYLDDDDDDDDAYFEDDDDDVYEENDYYVAENYSNNESNGEFVFPNSDSSYLTTGDLNRIRGNKRLLRIARNELYARHGYIFQSGDLSSYFNAKSWYVGLEPDQEYIKNHLFNDYELENLKLIISYEEELN